MFRRCRERADISAIFWTNTDGTNQIPSFVTKRFSMKHILNHGDDRWILWKDKQGG
jgi:hypothetical protein